MSADQPTVLVVEDEASQREVLRYNLEAEGFRVAAAGNGEEALVMLDEEEPDVIVLDWMLPNLSGIEVCRQIRMGSGPAGKGSPPNSSPDGMTTVALVAGDLALAGDRRDDAGCVHHAYAMVEGIRDEKVPLPVHSHVAGPEQRRFRGGPSVS